MLVVAVTKPVPEGALHKVEKSDPLTPAGFIGSMQGTMEIAGDIESPIDAAWEADQGCDQNHLL
jgi:hypothetical protein